MTGIFCTATQILHTAAALRLRHHAEDSSSAEASPSTDGARRTKTYRANIKNGAQNGLLTG